MKIAEHIQTAIHTLEVGKYSRWFQLLPLALAVFGLAVLYDLSAYRGFNSMEAMDAAQVARNVAEGRGFSTDFIRPFSVYLVQKHNHDLNSRETSLTNAPDYARLNSPHPDLANAPVYPLLLAGIFKVWSPDWKVNLRDPFWSASGKFQRYKPEFVITVLNQLLLIAVVVMTFLVARKLFDVQVALLAALLTLGAEVLWKFSVSGQSTILLLLIFLGLIWVLARVEEIGSVNLPDAKRLFGLAIMAGFLAGLGMMTRYAFGWVIVPVVVFFALFGGVRRPGLAVAAFLAFALTVTPWILRNLAVSGTFFGAAGFSIAEGSSMFPGAKLMQSTNPTLNDYYYYCVRFTVKKFLENIRLVLQSDLLRLAGGWVVMLFLAGLLLGLRSSTARRLRYFTLMCLGVFLMVQALGRTQLSNYSPEINSENLLVLLVPVVMIFGVAFFISLLNQMNAPSLEARYAVVLLMGLVCCQPFIASLLPPTVSPVAFPPYNPPEIQRISAWMRPDELMMSDMPWAVAWYGDRQCAWLTVNSGYEFTQLCYYIKRVNALYLTPLTLDSALMSECYLGPLDSWSNFSLQMLALGRPPEKFPLIFSPYGMGAAIFLSDKVRWPMEYP